VVRWALVATRDIHSNEEILILEDTKGFEATLHYANMDYETFQMKLDPQNAL
jgi:hypothetical protein